MRHAIQYGDVRIGFTIRFMAQRLRGVAIHVLPDGRVRVDAPESAEPAEVVDAVRRRARWIWQQQEACRERQRHVLPREYVSGETHFYLGRRYVLKVVVNGDTPPGVKLRGGQLEVRTHSAEAAQVRVLLDGWYEERAQEVFARCIAACASSTHSVATAPPFRLRSMKTQWGSCSVKGELLLNPQLVKAPRACVDYVVTHELCHLKEHNHSPRFYRLLSTTMPDWEARKRELDGMAELLLNR